MKLDDVISTVYSIDDQLTSNFGHNANLHGKLHKLIFKLGDFASICGTKKLEHTSFFPIFDKDIIKAYQVSVNPNGDKTIPVNKEDADKEKLPRNLHPSQHLPRDDPISLSMRLSQVTILTASPTCHLPTWHACSYETR
jgi:hypothetical protein